MLLIASRKPVVWQVCKSNWEWSCRLKPMECFTGLALIHFRPMSLVCPRLCEPDTNLNHFQKWGRGLSHLVTKNSDFLKPMEADQLQEKRTQDADLGIPGNMPANSVSLTSIAARCAHCACSSSSFSWHGQALMFLRPRSVKSVKRHVSWCFLMFPVS